MEITVKQAAAILEKIVANRIAGGNPPPAMLWGPPGIGKSAIINSIAKKLNLEVRDIRLAQLDPVDLRGIPTVENDQTKWAAPSFFPQDETSEGIIFLDELSAADQSIQVAAYQLLLDRRLGDYKVPNKWVIFAAGNRAEDNSVSLSMSAALANRMMHLELHADPEEWTRWASKNSIDPNVIGFIRFSPEMLFDMGECGERGWPSPRSWDNVSRISSVGLSEEDLASCVSGLVGDAVAMQFLSYRRQAKTFGNIRELMLISDSKLKIENKPDLCYAVASALAYWVWKGENESESKALLDGFFRCIAQLPPAFAAIAMIDAMEKSQDDSNAEKLMTHPDFIKWQERCGEEFSKRR